jgi:hypothetical protein
MARIEITRQHGLGRERAHRAAEAEADDLRPLRRQLEREIERRLDAFAPGP